MKIYIMGAGLAIAAFTLPVAAQARDYCGVPQGYGTNNSHTFNRSTCGLGDNSYHVPNSAKLGEFVIGSGVTKRRPAGYGTTNPFIPNSGAPHLGSNTAGN